MIGLNSGSVKVTEWNGGGAPVVPPNPPPPFEFIDLVSLPIPRSVGGLTGVHTIKDATFNITSEAAVYDDRQCILRWRGEAPEGAFVWQSSDATTATVDSEGFVTCLKSGVVRITVTLAEYSIWIDLTLTVAGGASSYELISYVEGSLAKHTNDAVDTRLAGKNAATAKRLFTTQNHATKTYVRNPAAWPADLGAALGCISPWNESGGPTRAGVLITPSIIVFARHYQINSGAVVRFVLPDGTVVERIMVSKRDYPQYPNLTTDLTIGLLSAPINDIPPAKVLPDDFQSYLPSVSLTATIPALCLDQDEDASVADCYNLTLPTASQTGSAQFANPNWINWAKRMEFFEMKRGGDSGNPAFVIINNQLVILTVFTYGGAGAGSALCGKLDVLNNMIAQFGIPDRLQVIDLTGFPTY